MGGWVWWVGAWMGEEEGQAQGPGLDGHGRWPALDRECLCLGRVVAVAERWVGDGLPTHWVEVWACGGRGGYYKSHMDMAWAAQGMRGCTGHAAQHQASCVLCAWWRCRGMGRNE